MPDRRFNALAIARCAAALTAAALLFGCFPGWDRNLPPAELITPGEDSAELYDPMAPKAFEVLETTNAFLKAEQKMMQSVPEAAQEPDPMVEGPGSSSDNPAIIRGVYSRLGKMDLENEFISAKLGKEGEAWQCLDSISQTVKGKVIETVRVKDLKSESQTELSFYFDITEYAESWEPPAE